MALDVARGRVEPRKECGELLFLCSWSMVHGPFLTLLSMQHLSRLAPGEPLDTFSVQDQEEIGCWLCRFRHITGTDFFVIDKGLSH